jgi:hypothetical protein
VAARRLNPHQSPTLDLWATATDSYWANFLSGSLAGRRSVGCRVTRCQGAWLVTLRDSCDELTIDPHAARMRLRQVGIKTGAAYRWPEATNWCKVLRASARERPSPEEGARCVQVGLGLPIGRHDTEGRVLWIKELSFTLSSRKPPKPRLRRTETYTNSRQHELAALCVTEPLSKLPIRLRPCRKYR